MVEIEVDKEKLPQVETENISSLREERQRTGRYVALGTAIGLSVLGLYQVVVSGTPQYAALFAPVLIMFVYILWVLNASAQQRKQMLAAAAAATEMCKQGEMSATVGMAGTEQPKTGQKIKPNKHGAKKKENISSTRCTSPMAEDKMAYAKEMVAKDVSELICDENYSPCCEQRLYSRSYSIA